MKQYRLFLLLLLTTVNGHASWYNCIACIHNCLKPQSTLRIYANDRGIRSNAIAVPVITIELREESVPLCYYQNGQSLKPTISVKATLVDENQEQNNQRIDTHISQLNLGYRFPNIR